jgi:CheY-specific phosphatase CheX
MLPVKEEIVPIPSSSTEEAVQSELAQIVEAVFENMIGLEVVRCPVPWFLSDTRLIAQVQMSGAWNGAVLLECDRSLACEFTRRFLSAAQSPPCNDVVRDMLGELANMIGGNWKCSLGRGIHLSTPSVADGGGSSLSSGAVEVQEQLAFQCSQGIFWVSILAL